MADVEVDMRNHPLLTLVALTHPVRRPGATLPLGRHCQSVHLHTVHVEGEAQAMLPAERAERQREAGNGAPHECWVMNFTEVW